MSGSYVSPELHHFVGRPHLGDPEAAYGILKKILAENHLYCPKAANPHAIAFDIDIEASLLEQKMFVPNCVCFCDIPVDCLQIHTSKYGSFGLSFDKMWIIERRARPVIYLPVFRRDWQTPLDGRNAIRDIEAVYKSLVKLVDDRVDSRTWGKIAETPEEAMFAAISMLDHNFLGFLKPFGPEWPDDSPHQYYMEREWRILGSLKFAARDIAGVFIPDNFRDRFKGDFPDFAGAVRVLPIQ